MLFSLLALSQSLIKNISIPCQGPYDPLTLACFACKSNSFLQSNRCKCLPGYSADNQLSINPNCNLILSCSNQLASAISNIQGQRTPTCISCKGISNYDICMPCKVNEIFTTSCSCSGLFTQSSQGCLQNSLGPMNQQQLSAYQLCNNFDDWYGCSTQINLCVLSQGTSNSCKASQLSKQSVYLNSDFSTLVGLSFRLYKFSRNGSLIWANDLQNVMGQLNFCSSRTLSSSKAFYQRCSINSKWIHQSNFTYQLRTLTSEGWKTVPVQGLSDKKLVRRFFMIGVNSIVTSLILSINLNSTIQVPTLKLTYGPISTTSFQFQVNYSTNLFSFWLAAGILLALFSLFSLVHTCFNIYAWNKCNPSQFLGEPWGSQMLSFSFFRFIQNWSLWISGLLLFFTGYWYFFTKFSQVVTIYPEASLDLPLFFLIGALSSFSIISIWRKQLKAAELQLFCIDWQKEGHNTSWRPMYILQQFIRISFSNNFNYFWIFLWTAFFLNGINVQLWASSDTIANQGPARLSPVLLSFLTVCCSMGTALTLKIIRKLLSLWWPYQWQDFLDLCSVCNISLLLVHQNSCQGYYIHAVNPNGSQGSLHVVNNFLENQVRLGKNRGFDQSNCQCFVFYLTKQMMETIRAIKIQQSSRNNKLKIRIGFTGRDLKYILPSIINDNQAQIRNNSFLYSFFGLPAISVKDMKKVPELIRDPFTQFTVYFSNGNQLRELALLVNVILGGVILFQNGSVGIFLAYILYQLGSQLGQRLLRNNLSQQSNVNEGFLI